MNVLCEIQKNYTLFSEKERDIADYILQSNDQIKNINITDLSKAIGVSNATITRFSKKIGCKSFVDMKIQLSAASTRVEDLKDEGVFSDIYSFYKSTIDMTNHLIDKEMIFKFVKEIKNAKRIYICGVGSSGFTASEFALRLLRMGFNVSSITDSHMMIINSSILSKEDLIVGISLSGETNEVVQSLRIGKANGATSVAMTSFENSSIAMYSDMNFILYNSGFIDKERFVNSQFSAMYVVDLICSVLLRDKELKDKMQLTVDTIIGMEYNKGKNE
ncbi:transcriptional regulator, RpiR family [Clostridium cadaveris]|uniref:MurR/RpiR family transcriptional regulator n=2 Tax=Clostridium cadaveris TaxID=1529 RepID=A0A1I2PGT4_9CLOT|nr:MurR/RpiR family transcriptional regulator [Clostridium cadaveris]NME63629.1 MurR/RpiR family transcriptional regulator [Clostridium cadaveris]NWK10662.1 MurR/RpiR family transcriptional regulator [Clostridium cadaveris]PWL54639.1 MAG: MurR/RpiR family transcriptional regulator [Clostridium cadaveris]UFH63709.1 MurR/RpiR family transcriptional regulator [Clostridium cadaveris]SFG12651.1 transcriptional regulator, RpiR family [Clostridium cadaveris]